MQDVQLPENVYLGFTAHTGELTGIASILYSRSLLTNSPYWVIDDHDIISVSTRTLPPKAREPVKVRIDGL